MATRHIKRLVNWWILSACGLLRLTAWILENHYYYYWRDGCLMAHIDEIWRNVWCWAASHGSNFILWPDDDCEKSKSRTNQMKIIWNLNHGSQPNTKQFFLFLIFFILREYSRAAIECGRAQLADIPKMQYPLGGDSWNAISLSDNMPGILQYTYMYRVY